MGMLGSCSVGEKRVLYSEMKEAPQLQLDGQILIIKTKNSGVNSALKIFEIKEEVGDHIINLKAYQALNKDIKEQFLIDLEKYHIGDLKQCEFYWIDPDGNRTKLELEQ